MMCKICELCKWFESIKKVRYIGLDFYGVGICRNCDSENVNEEIDGFHTCQNYEAN